MGSSDGEAVMLRPNAVRALAVLTWLLMAVYLGWTLLVDLSAGLRFTPIAALVSAVVYALFWRPGVAVDADSRDARQRAARHPHPVLAAALGADPVRHAGRDDGAHVHRLGGAGARPDERDVAVAARGVGRRARWVRTWSTASARAPRPTPTRAPRHCWCVTAGPSTTRRWRSGPARLSGSAPADTRDEPVTTRWAAGVVGALVVLAVSSALSLLL